jgi:hypothetical protein
MMEGLDHGFGLLPDDTGTSRVETEWDAFCDAMGASATARRDGRAVAHAIAHASATRPDAASQAARMFLRVADAAGADPGADRLLPVLANTLAALPPAALQRTLAAMEVGERKQFLSAHVAVVPPSTVLALCTAAGAAFEQPLSAPLMRLMAKLRTEAETADPDRRRRAESSFRGLVMHLLDTWSASTVNSATTSFDALFQEQKTQRVVTRVTPEPLRVLQVALEAGVMGNVVWGAVADQTRSEAGMRAVFDMLKELPVGNEAADAILGHLATPARLAGLMKEEPIDFVAVDGLIRNMGVAAVRPLIEELTEAKTRTTRREIMDRLVGFGPTIGPFVMEHLEDERWYVVRNMIALLREAGCSVDDVPVERFRAHNDARVRRETLQLQLENPSTRDAALVEALADNDKHVLRTALQAARSDLPESAVSILARRVMDSAFPPEFRVISLFLLGRSGSIHALDTLLAFVAGGKTLFGKPKLAPKSPEMLAALGGLARSWPNEKRASALLELARESKDDQIINALKAAPPAS